MDPALIAAALIGASTGQSQLAASDKMLAISLDSTRQLVNLIDSAQQSIDNSLANLSAGIGGNLNISA